MIKGHVKSSSESGNKLSSGFINKHFLNSKNKNVEIFSSQSQKNIKSPNLIRTIDSKSRPNTGGGKKSPFRSMTPNTDNKKFNQTNYSKSQLMKSMNPNPPAVNQDRPFSSSRLLKSTNFSNSNSLLQKTTPKPLEKSINQGSYREKSNLNISKLSDNNNNSFLGTNRSKKRSNTPMTGSITQNKSVDLKNKIKPNSKSPFGDRKKIVKDFAERIKEEKKRNISPILGNGGYLKKVTQVSKANLRAVTTNETKDQNDDVIIINNQKGKTIAKPNFSVIKPLANKFKVQKITNSMPNLLKDNNEINKRTKDEAANSLTKENSQKHEIFLLNNTSPLLKHNPDDKFKFSNDFLLQGKPQADSKKDVNQSKQNNLNSSSNSISKDTSREKSDQTTIKTIKTMFDVTKKGYSGPGVAKINQDNFFIYKNFNNNPNSIYFGVCDGHGTYGHEVSKYLVENLPITLDHEFRKRFKPNNIPLRNKIISEVFNKTNDRLNNETETDTNFSGSTCVTLIYSPEKIICANVGDSRAVLGRFVDGKWIAHDLTHDHKPSDIEEKRRIYARGGRVEPFRDEDDGSFIGPDRVWLADQDIPGLAMSRSYGDQVAASVGVTSEPEITEWTITKDDMFFIIASDGVWEFIESSECVNIIKDYYLKGEIKEAAEYIVRESTERWLKEEEVIDDITLVLVYFN